MDVRIPQRHFGTREGVAWSTPLARILLWVPKPRVCAPESGLCAISLRELKKQVKTLDDFVSLCRISLDLVERISAQLLSLLQRIVTQYLDFVCGICSAELQTAILAVAGVSTLQAQLDRFNEHQQRLLQRLGAESAGAECGYGGWIAMTVYDVVYHALAELAVRHGFAFGHNLTSTLKDVEPLVTKWVTAAEGLAPSTLCYDLKYCLVGTTFAHWRGWERLQAWEKDIRKWRIREDIRVACEGAERESRAVVASNGALDNSALISLARGRLRNDATFSRCSKGGLWWSANGLNLRPKDQCPTCQVWFEAACLATPNQPQHRDRLGEKRDEAHPWQCAEVDLLSQLLDSGCLEVDATPPGPASRCECKA